MKLPKNVTIKEVGPRDGLQNEKQQVPTEAKISWIDSLSVTGLSYIEVSSFVHPRWIPQLADAAKVLKQIKRKQGLTYAALVPNLKGLDGALEAGVDEVSVFMSASEAHNRSNINKSIDATYPVLEEVVREAKLAGKTVRGYVSTVISCPYEGYIAPEKVRVVAERLFEMGIDELSLGETIGVAVPTQVEQLLEDLLPHFEAGSLAMHFHDTRGTALANIVKSLEMGITTFDSALGGLGGCPYAKGASGNVATEDLLYMLHEMGIETGVDLVAVLKSAQLFEKTLSKPLRSRQMEILRGEGEECLS
ncbi:hydroxymethylglutaryl-CoA lyase [Bacillus sp. FJAT-27251]|uniref:hydroxymethylglutaryl-CoA lyase n=1 Tax=Bacillus sp. FJAT-27251 TaxID=1684142 RepID=UPI0006A7609B|nr:hydroxymethylglutaryl-CoA lyase [Bacillus sp. FJAT-27251]